MTFGGSLVRTARFVDFKREFFRKSRAKRSLGRNLVGNARFADLTCDFWRKSRAGAVTVDLETLVVAHKSVLQSPTKVSHKNVLQECAASMSHKSVLQE